jgi:hypothetical protein
MLVTLSLLGLELKVAIVVDGVKLEKGLFVSMFEYCITTSEERDLHGELKINTVIVMKTKF